MKLPVVLASLFVATTAYAQAPGDYTDGTAAPDVSDEVTPARPCVFRVHKPKTIIFALEADTGNTRDLVPTTNATYCFPPTA